MTMTIRHLILGLGCLAVLGSCTDDRYYDTYPYGAYGSQSGRPAAPRAPYGGQGYGATPPQQGSMPPGYSPYAPGAQAAQGYQQPQQPAPTPAPAPAPAKPSPAGRNYPVARPTGTPGIVFSPYNPTKKIDVTGFRPGQRVKDEQTGEIFLVP